MDPNTLQTWLPLVVIAAVFALRFRNLQRAVPFRPGRLWIAPLLLTAMVSLLVYAKPPDPVGWMVILFGTGIGALVGWKRGHLMHLERDPGNGAIMMRQSPAALLLILGIILARRLLTVELGITPGAVDGHATHAAILLTDGLMGFALGMVVALRWTLWQRAGTVPPHEQAMG